MGQRPAKWGGPISLLSAPSAWCSKGGPRLQGGMGEAGGAAPAHRFLRVEALVLEQGPGTSALLLLPGPEHLRACTPQACRHCQACCVEGSPVPQGLSCLWRLHPSDPPAAVPLADCPVPLRNIHVQVLVETYIFISLGHAVDMELLDQIVTLCLPFRVTPKQNK